MKLASLNGEINKHVYSEQENAATFDLIFTLHLTTDLLLGGHQ